MNEAPMQTVESIENDGSSKPRLNGRTRAGLGLIAVATVCVGIARLFGSSKHEAGPAPGPVVSVSEPLQKEIGERLQFLGQFSGVEEIELRPQVGGTLTQICFKDGDIVEKGALLFVIDSTQYEIKMSNAKADLDTAKARLELASRELVRAETLKKTDAGTTENVEQRAAEKQQAQAAIEGAEAMVRDAQFDLDHTRITAPFKGRIGAHLVSAGNLVAGSRAASSPTTLLAILVSLDPIYLNFDMSESDYLAFSRERAKQNGMAKNKVDVALGDEASFKRQGSLDFVDNALDRTSGTIHARATVPNSDLFLTPGGFARVRLAVTPPSQVLLVPDASVFADQSYHMVLVVGADETVQSKTVKLGELRGGLRVIREGLLPTDKVIVAGMSTVQPGTKVSTSNGTIQYAANRD